MKKTISIFLSLFWILVIAGCTSEKESSSLIESSSIQNSSSTSGPDISSEESSSSTDVELISYYADLDLTKKDVDFRKELSSIISSGYVAHSYSYNNTVLAKTDADLDANGNVICFYTGRSLKDGEWNKEHVWAKSHGFPVSTTNPYCDAHHLRPTLISINSSRGSSDFGEVTGGSSDEYGNKWTNSLFEPRDEVKGDVARMMFYMATRYGFDGVFNLSLVNESTTTTSSSNGRFGNLDTLIKWHYEDPVSESEIRRNNIIYEDYQHNRNPYIDYPFFVDLAYPNPYSSEEINQEKVDSVIIQINTLPKSITLADKKLVEDTKLVYLELNYNERSLVTNYSVLQAAIDKIKELENQQQGSIWKETLDLTALSGTPTSYSKDFTCSVESRNFIITYGGFFSGEHRLGGNKPTELAEKYNITGASADGSALVCDFDLENVKTIQFECSKSYGIVDYMYIIASTDGGETYYKVKQEKGYNNLITAELDNSLNARFALVIVGKTPRVVLANMRVGIK